MTFAVGLVAGIVATVLVALLVFKARVIAGTAKPRLPDLRMAIAVAALIVAIVALVRSGHTSDSRSTNPAGTLLSGNGRTCVRSPARCNWVTASDWESPVTFGTVTVVKTVDVVEEGPPVGAEFDGAGEVEGVSLASTGVVDPESEV